MSDLAPGTRIERYEVVRELGQGGMAVVYEVRHVELGSRHALKLLWPGPPQLAERLVQEGRVQAQLSHPNLVAVTDVVVVDRRPALVLEYVDGLPLDDWLAAHPDADEATRRRLACQVLQGVAHAHAQGTIHRDLKPANVLVTGDATPWAKVADFGLAKWLHAADGGTRTGVPMGTPRYMAPEQIRDAKHVDERADVFALGCILCELWGKPAFSGETIPELFERIVTGKFQVPPNAPSDVQAAIRAALEPDPGMRIQTVSGLHERLGCEGTVSRMPAAVPPRRAPWLIAGLGGGLAVGAAGIAFVTTAAALALLWWGSTVIAVPTPVPVPVAQPAPSPEPVAPAPRRGRPGRARPAPPEPVPVAPAPAPSPAPSPSPVPPPKPGKGKDDDKGKDDEKGEKGKSDKD